MIEVRGHPARPAAPWAAARSLPRRIGQVLAVAHDLRMEPRELDDAPDGDRAEDDEADDRPERCGGGLSENEHADQHGDHRIDDGQSRDHEIGRAGRVRGLHEVGARRRAEQQRDAGRPG